MKTNNREIRARSEALESALQGARRDVTQLESARDWAAISRARMAEQQQVAERLQRELDATKTALASAEAENQQLRSKAASTEKKLLRLEAKVVAMLNDTLLGNRYESGVNVWYVDFCFVFYDFHMECALADELPECRESNLENGYDRSPATRDGCNSAASVGKEGLGNQQS